MTVQARYRWIRIYQKVLRSTFHTIRGTNSIHIQHHLNIPDFSRRMSLLNSKHFSRYLRSPRSGLLYQELSKTWWLIIKHHSLHHSDSFFTKHDLYTLRLRHSHQWLLENVVPLHGTVIWHLFHTAYQWKNDDLKYIRSSTKLHHLQPRLSSYISLNLPWTQCSFDPVPFTDFYLSPTFQTHSLLLFTDGSVEEGQGGYGWLQIPQSIYFDWDYLSSHSTQQRIAHHNSFRNYIDTQSHHPYILAHSVPLSLRCTIEFCEAHAIHDALQSIVTKCTSNSAYLSSFTQLRVISDSETVLRYITGEYHVSTPSMKEIITKIHG